MLTLFPFRLQLRTVVSLTPEPPTEDLAEFCRHERIALLHLETAPFREQVVFSPAAAVSVLQLLIDAERLPLYLHCIDGANNTGVIVMCLRKLQNWSMASAYTEFARFVTDHAVSHEEQVFLEREFRVEVTMPERLPNWLWGGMPVTSHPTLRIRRANTTGAVPRAESPPRGQAAHDPASPHAPRAHESRHVAALALETRPHNHSNTAPLV